MPKRSFSHLALFACLACLATTLSCAVADVPDTSPPAIHRTPPLQSAARMGLAPMYRGFYDALEGEGEWVLIEPYGWVFRPAVNFDSWRPYQRGWWEASDAFGWVWNSTDPFGWVTDHYGSWFHDAYQGWVWQPGPVWGPAWVAWVAVDDYVGWAPLAPSEYDDFSRIPGNVFTFAMAQQFGSMQSNSQALFLARPPVSGQAVSEVSNATRRDSVAFNRGPDFDLLRRLGGTVAVHTEEPNFRRVQLPGVVPPGESDLLLRTKRLVAVGVRELSQAPAATPAPATPPVAAPRAKDAPPDSADRRSPAGKDPKRGPGKPPRPAEVPGHPGAERDSTRR